LVESITQAGKIRRGEILPVRSFKVIPKFPLKQLFRSIRLPRDHQKFWRSGCIFPVYGFQGTQNPKKLLAKGFSRLSDKNHYVNRIGFSLSRSLFWSFLAFEGTANGENIPRKKSPRFRLSRAPGSTKNPRAIFPSFNDAFVSIFRETNRQTKNHAAGKTSVIWKSPLSVCLFLF